MKSGLLRIMLYSYPVTSIPRMDPKFLAAAGTPLVRSIHEYHAVLAPLLTK
jgi:hypothetical protein